MIILDIYIPSVSLSSLFSLETERKSRHDLRTSWSPNSTDLYFWHLFVEFVSVVPAAKKSKLGTVFFFKISALYTNCPWKSKKRAKAGQKIRFYQQLWPAGQVVSQKLPTLEEQLGKLVKGAIKNTFFGCFLSVFLQFFYLLRTICILLCKRQNNCVIFSEN